MVNTAEAISVAENPLSTKIILEHLPTNVYGWSTSPTTCALEQMSLITTPTINPGCCLDGKG